jgi:hypothetical protein
VFDNRVRVQERHARVVLKPLPKKKGDVPPALIQERAAPSYEAIMEGYAIRIKFPIVPPKLTSVGGTPAFLLNQPGQGFRTWVGANFAAPAWFAQWSMRYVLGIAPPGPIQGPDNPLMGQKVNAGNDKVAPSGVFGMLTTAFLNAAQAAQAAGSIVLPPKL